MPAGGPLWVGGFAFASDGAGTGPWASYPAALLVLPEVTLVRRGEQVTATLSAVCRPGDDPARIAARMSARLGGLRRDPMPLVTMPWRARELLGLASREKLALAVAATRDLAWTAPATEPVETS